ncbi:MAG: DUF4080 domain-containing protein [Gammaproteobacteria bacterium]|nr:DUF4080 domain-containing protein [Gammaproteobacteria bacterium]MBU1655136.1 DUF4080 domain-containing protein [Gammaproteobacteria bacterium]MBU1962102.1 DUF4080 domain-containing protein [Gammaproteobacteria bacterium]
MPQILLTTLNARYIHSALGLRYLLANMGELRGETAIREFTLEPTLADIAEQLLRARPRIIGIGVYIWNAEQSARLAGLLKAIAPEVILVLGGPEVSHEWQGQPIVETADYLITGQADLAFAGLCRRVLAGDPPVEKVLHAPPPALDRLTFPYDGYTDEDIAHRVIYVEASRGCPFRCEFCLSALDKTAHGFDLEAFLREMDRLYRRGLRHFKFVDRTFNLNPHTATAILEFFLARLDERLFLHFELVPDHLPERLKALLQRFPAGTLQLEIGVQSFNSEAQALISRRQDNELTRKNLAWLRDRTEAHLHADLIVGLPGEDMASFGRGFDALVALRPQEIQMGILKRLRGAPIARHAEASRMRFSPAPPYEVMATDRIDFFSLQRLKRFARYWDLIANTGRFPATLPLILGDRPFDRFLVLSDWLHETTGQSSQIALKRLFDLLAQGLPVCLGLDRGAVEEGLEADFRRSGVKGLPGFLMLAKRAETPAIANSGERPRKRQRRHGIEDISG